MNALIDLVTQVVRERIFVFAKLLNKVTGGKLKPDYITWTGLAMHIPVAYLIAVEQNVAAALLLVVFGLFDALDGALAKAQQKVSNKGMLLDASTDRFKEVLLYSGAAYVISTGNEPRLATWAVVACGMSICVSYIKAKGETAIRGSNLTATDVNRIFTDGLLRFQVRMSILVLGLMLNQLLPAIIIIAVLSTLTAFDRLIKISRKL